MHAGGKAGGKREPGDGEAAVNQGTKGRRGESQEGQGS